MAEKNEKIGALWVRESDKGEYFTGEIDGQKVVIFQNNYKDTEKHPDFIVYKSRPRE